MKRTFMAIALLLASVANAQSSNWKIVSVQNTNNEVVGHIYHTESIGRQVGASPEKVATGLRLVCSRLSANGNEDALIVLYWQGMFGNIPEDVTITVDGRKIGVGQPYTWKRDGPVLVRTVAESVEITNALKTGRSINFSWKDTGNVQRTTVFDLRSFNSNISSFNSSCKTNI